MAGRKTEKRIDISEIRDYARVVVHNKGKRSFLVKENGADQMIEAGGTFEVSGATAKFLCAYPREIDVVSTSVKSGKSLDSETVKALQGTISTLETRVQELEGQLEDHDALDARVTEVSAREEASTKKEEENNARETAVQKREDEIGPRETAAVLREEAVQLREDEVTKREEALKPQA